MAQYLCRIQPARRGFFDDPTAEEEAPVGQHFAYLERLTRRRVVLLAGRTLNEDPTGFGIVVFEASSDTEARSLVSGDPAVQAGVFVAELFPYRVALASPRLLDLTPASRPQDGASLSAGQSLLGGSHSERGHVVDVKSDLVG
jgi:uncharacterized protein YciI